MMPQPAGSDIILCFLQLAGIIFTDGIHNRITGGGDKGIKLFSQHAVFNHRCRQSGNGTGKGNIHYFLVITDARIMNGHHHATTGKIMALSRQFPHQRGQGGGMTIVTMDHIGPLVQMDHNGQSSLLQKDIHGKIIIMTAAFLFPALCCLFLGRVGIHP